MGYLTNSGSGFLSNAVTTVSNVKSYLVNKTGYLVDSIRVGIGDFGQRVLDDGGTIEASAEAAASYREITKDIYDQASLVLFPSGYKDNLLYSHKPVNGSGDFTYTRGTDTATRVGADGYIKKERANLLEQSNQFDTTWTRNGITPTSGQSGYDGSNNAWLIEKTLTNAYRSIVQDVSISGVQTFSLYCKGGTLDIMTIYIAGSANAFAEFDVSTGNPTSGTIISQSFAAINPKIENFGNGWYRLSVNCNSTTNQVRIYPDWDLNNLGTIYIQDAQLEQGLVATPYIETTTAPVYEGLTDNLPRIDYTGGTPSILLEPSRQNRLPNSEYFGDWTNTSASFVYNVSNSPQGVKNAIRIIPNSSDFEIKTPVNTTVASTESTFSVFLKYETGGFEYAVLGSGAPQQRYVFNIAEGTKVGSIGSTSIPDEKASIENYGNGWYRCVVTTNNTGGNKHSIYLSDDGTDIAATGADGTKGMLAWGAQAERENSYATSYIPTYNASATRNTDVTLSLTNAGADGLINNYNTTIFINLKKIISVNNVIRFVTLFPNGGANNPRVLLYGNMNNALVQYRVTGQADQSITSPYNRDEVNKIAIRISGTSLTMFHNGEEVNTITIVQGDDLEYLSLAELAATDSGYLLNQLLSFPTALSDDDCKALTAL